MPVWIPIAKELASFLQGRPLGKKHYPRLCELLSDAPVGERVVLDFGGVETVTSSWINEALVPMLRWSADERVDLFPILLNFEAGSIDELKLVADWTHNCFLMSSGRSLKSGILIGNLDFAQRATLHAVLEVPGITGAELERRNANEGIRATAWNNRLRDLYDKRLLRREKRSREQLYSPVIPEIRIDG